MMGRVPVAIELRLSSRNGTTCVSRCRSRSSSVSSWRRRAACCRCLNYAYNALCQR